MAAQLCEILKTTELYRLKRTGRAHGFYLQKAVIRKTHITGPGVAFLIGIELPGRQGRKEELGPTYCEPRRGWMADESLLESLPGHRQRKAPDHLASA